MKNILTFDTIPGSRYRDPEIRKIGHREICGDFEWKECTNFRKDWPADKGLEGISKFLSFEMILGHMTDKSKTRPSNHCMDNQLVLHYEISD